MASWTLWFPAHSFCSNSRLEFKAGLTLNNCVTLANVLSLCLGFPVCKTELMPLLPQGLDDD